jgi:hypothetical protein
MLLAPSVRPRNRSVFEAGGGVNRDLRSHHLPCLSRGFKNKGFEFSQLLEAGTGLKLLRLLP